MALEIAVGPSQLALHQGQSVLITDRDGQIPWPSDKGLYFFDTRLISSWSIYVARKMTRSRTPDVDEELRYHSLLDIEVRRTRVRFVRIADIPGGSADLHCC